MKKAAFTIIMMFSLLAVAVLVGCGGSASSSSASSSVSSASASSSASSSGSVMEIDGVTVKDLRFEMVGDMPNLMIVFSNPTDQAVDVDLSKFQIKVDDKDEVSFHLTSKTIDANKPYAQWAFTAKPGSMKVGDSVTVYYDGKQIGTYKVTEF